MKLPAITLLALVINLFTIAAQDKQTSENPFDKLGYNPLVATSSRGDYEEFHDKEDLVEIGSVLFNTKTNKVVRILKDGETTVDLPTATAAMSIAPLCEKYYWISPYAYCANNPIGLIDPTGMTPERPQGLFDAYIIDPDGKTVDFIKTDDPYDVLIIKGQDPITYEKGELTPEYYTKLGYSVRKTHAAGMSITDFGLSIFGGEIAFAKFAPYIGSVFSKITAKVTGSTSKQILAKISGILRDATKKKGNYSLGEGSTSEAMEAGKAWVGSGARLSSDGKTLISADGLRQFRPPSYKPNLGKTQANFEWKNAGQTQWQSNGHLTIIE